MHDIQEFSSTKLLMQDQIQVIETLTEKVKYMEQEFKKINEDAQHVHSQFDEYKKSTTEQLSIPSYFTFTH